MDLATVFYGLDYSTRVEKCVEWERLAGFVHAGPYSILFALHFDDGSAWVDIVISGHNGRVLLQLSRGLCILIDVVTAAIGRNAWILQSTRRVHSLCFISALSYPALF